MADARVAAAIANWAPRFITQGVDFNDFQRITSRLERWEDWLDAWCDAADGHAAQALLAEQQGHLVSAGEAWLRAALGFHFAKFVWLLDPQRHHLTTRKAIEALAAGHRLLDPTAERIDVPWEGHALFGNLRRPAGQGRVPLVVLLPGLDSTKEEFFRWEGVFLRRGMATFSFDGPGQGESRVRTTIRADYELAITAALDRLRLHPWIDSARVGVVGVALGGYYAGRAAAFETRVTAACSIGGPFDFGAAWDDLPTLSREAFAFFSGATDADEARRKASELRLEAVAHLIRCPLLVIFGRMDRLIPYQQAEAMAASVSNSTLVMFEEGNHVCNNIPYKYRPLAGDWMADRLNAGPG